MKMTDDIPDDIITEIMNRRCLFFIGAGMAIEAGLPSGKQLAEDLFNSLKKDGYSRPDDFTLPRLAQDFESMRSRKELEETIRKKIADAMRDAIRDSKNDSYKLLSNLKPLPNDIITTNYDRLLENALGESNYIPILNNRAISKHNLSITNLFKIHGDIDNLETSIITENDIRRFEEKYPNIWNEIKSLFQKRTVVFLGYSIEDKHIRNIYLKIRDQLGEHAPKAYAVSPDDESQLRLGDIGVKHIKLTAKAFLNRLIKKMDKDGYTTLPFDIPQSPNPNNNPFSIYSTEYFPENNREELINCTFIEPINFAMIIEPGNTIIEGHRGSGKSMILKYLSYEAQCKRNFKEKWDKNYVGLYLKFKPTVVDTTIQGLFKGKDSKHWLIYFMNYTNLLIGEEIIRTLKFGIDNKYITIDSEECFVSEIVYLFFESYSYPTKEKTLKNLHLLIKRVRNDLVQKHISEWDLPSDFLEQMIFSIKEHVKEWSEKNFYILLDEYDNLNDDQQRVVNTLIKNRSFSYKIGVKLHDMIYEDISGNLLERNNDYTYVNTDRFDFDPHSPLYSQFEDFLIEVANKRLEAYEYMNIIEELIPDEKDETRKGFENGDYSGFKNVARLSSGSIRDFLELCKDMVYYSNLWVIKEKRNKLDIILPNIQNAVIKIHSNILYENVNKIVGFDDESQKSNSYNAKLLIDKFSIIFERILRGSMSKEERTVSAFQLRNVEKLNKTAINALKDCTSYRLLQVPFNPRRPQSLSRHAPHDKYKFNRLLNPRFRLSLAERWPKEISSEVFNELFRKPDDVVNEVTKYFVKNIPPTLTTNLTYFEEKNGTKSNKT